MYLHVPRYKYVPVPTGDRAFEQARAGRRSGSGWRQGRVRWGRPLLSRPWAAAVESAAVSVLSSRGRAGQSVIDKCVEGLDGGYEPLVMRFVCVIRVPVYA